MCHLHSETCTTLTTRAKKSLEAGGHSCEVILMKMKTSAIVWNTLVVFLNRFSCFTGCLDVSYETESDYELPYCNILCKDSTRHGMFQGFDWVILLCGRLISHVPLAVPHYTTCDTTVLGKHVPANTTVSLSLLHQL